MAKRCTRCGNFLMDDERFCTRCGENVSNVAPENAVPPVVNARPAEDNAFGRNDGYVSPNAQTGTGYQQPYNNTYSQTPYQQPPYPRAAYGQSSQSEEMSVGKWVATIIVTTFFSLISLIFLFIWAFGDGPESRKRYCKAMLIVTAISIGLGILVYGVFLAILVPSFTEYINKARDYANEYGQNTIAALAAFFGH